MLTKKENYRLALKHDPNQQWVPFSNDCCQMMSVSVLQEKPPFGQNGTDWYGGSWLWDGMCFGHAPDVRQEPIVKDITRWRDYVHFPDVESLDWEAAAARDTAQLDRENCHIRYTMDMGPFERANNLLGYTEAFMAMAEEPEAYKELIDAIADFKIQLLHKILPLYRPDEVMFHDDLGTSIGPMISLDMYREILKPAHKRIIDTVHSYGVLYNHHSCGKMELFIDDLIEIGVDLINPIQRINDWKSIAEKYGDKVVFDVGCGNNDRPELTTEDIHEEVHTLIDTFGPTHGLIINSFPTNAACMDHLQIIADEVRRYGKEFYEKREG